MEKFECVECYEEYEKDEMIETAYDELFCEDCADDYTVSCHDCDDIIRDDESYYIDSLDEVVCENCFEDNYVMTDCCNEFVNADEAVITQDTEEYFCDHECLYNSGGLRCEDCGDCVSEDNRGGSDVYGDYCVICNQVNENIRDYHDNPPVEFYGEADNRRYFGVELELDNGDSNGFADDFNEHTEERIFLMEDSSLSPEGVEVITQPMSLEEHMDGGVWEKVREHANMNGLLSHDTTTCGLHIHVSRDGLSSHDAIDNIIFLVNRFWNKMVKFSRRDISELRQWADKTINKVDADIKMSDVHNSCKEGRYNAINLNNYATIEFRFFKGSTRVDTIKSSIQLVDMFTRVANMYDENMESIEDIEWEFLVNLAKDEYELLYDELERLELI